MFNIFVLFRIPGIQFNISLSGTYRKYSIVHSHWLNLQPGFSHTLIFNQATFSTEFTTAVLNQQFG